MENRKSFLRCCLFSFLLLFCHCFCLSGQPLMAMKGVAVKVGVVVDLSGTVGKMSKSYMELALSDFYTANPKYRTRLRFLFRNAGDVVGVASAAEELLGAEVVAIIGPATSDQARFVAELGRKSEVPIISFTATAPSLSPIQNPYFIRTALNDSAQVEAINAIIQFYGWREIVPIYEDTDFGHAIIPYLADALQENGTRFVCRTRIAPSFNDTQILIQLNRLKSMRKRLFLLHMTASLGSKLLVLAKKENMMSEGYAWIVTDGLSSLLDPITDSKALDSMQGIVGVRPYLPLTAKRLVDFQTRLKRIHLPNQPASLNLFALQAYDTVWALGMAVENASLQVNSTFIKNALMRKKLLGAILDTRFEGVSSGDFHLVNGELERSVFEIFNLVSEEERIIGYWSSERGLSKEVNDHEVQKSADKGKAKPITKQQLKQPIWPGDTTSQPLMNLIIGIPVKEGFKEFIKVDKRKKPPTGFCIDVFKSAVEVLEFGIEYTFVPFMNESGESNGTYDELLYQIPQQTVDAIVGDITIIANRSKFVDFTLPYSESGVSMVVALRNDRKKNMWIFLKPLSWDLWLVSFISFIFTGFVVWILECRENSDFGGPPRQQVGTIFWFSFSTLVFAHRERILNNLSRFLLIIWVFVVLILTQSYTANLSSMLTAQRLKPSFVDANEIRLKGYAVGHQKGSFVKDLLVSELGFSETKLKEYRSSDEFLEALSNGSDHGGVAAIFDEIPYIKVFLSKHGSDYQMVGPTYKTGGFGFAFSKGSPLVAYFSRAILNITEDKDKMDGIELKYFSYQDDQSATTSSSDGPILDAYSFAGLFIITAGATFASLSIYVTQFLHSHWPNSSSIPSESSFSSKLVEMAKLFYTKHFDSCGCLQKSESRVHSAMTEATVQNNQDHDNSSSFTERAGNLGVNENEDEILAREHNDQSMNNSTN